MLQKKSWPRHGWEAGLDVGASIAATSALGLLLIGSIYPFQLRSMIQLSYHDIAEIVSMVFALSPGVWSGAGAVSFAGIFFLLRWLRRGTELGRLVRLGLGVVSVGLLLFILSIHWGLGQAAPQVRPIPSFPWKVPNAGVPISVQPARPAPGRIPEDAGTPDLAVIILESFRSDRFTSEYLPKTSARLRQDGARIFLGALSAGTETALSIPRLLHGTVGPLGQLFSCRNSLFSFWTAAGRRASIWASQSYHWKSLASLFSCAAPGALEVTSPSEVRGAWKRGELPVSSPDAQLFALPHAVADSVLLDELGRRLTLGGASAATRPELHWIHNYDTHFPFSSSRTRSETRSESDTFASMLGRFAEAGTARGLIVRGLRDRYDGAVRDSDEFIVRALSTLEAHARKRGRGLFYVITADHGELLGEHDRIMHASASYPFEELVRVPLVFGCAGCAPKVSEKWRRISLGPERASASHLDILPTVLGILGFDSMRSIRFDGSDLSQGLQGGRRAETVVDHLRLATYHLSHKLVANAASGRFEIFDLRVDPREEHPVLLREAKSGLGEAYRALDPRVAERLGFSLPGSRSRGPRVVAHRGLHEDFAENSIQAFKEAVLAGAEGIELDVRWTADGQVVVHHDSKFRDREGRFLRVEEATLAHIQALNPAVPSLEEVFEALGPTLSYIVEMKVDSGANPLLAAAVARMIDRHELRERVLTSSVNLAQAEMFRRYHPQHRVLFELYHFDGTSGAQKFVDELPSESDRVHVSFGARLFSPGLFKSIQRRFAGSSVFTPNELGELQKFAQLGVDWIQTDNVGGAIEAIDGVAQSKFQRALASEGDR